MSDSITESDRTRQLREVYEIIPKGDSHRGLAYDAWKDSSDRDRNPQEWAQYDEDMRTN